METQKNNTREERELNVTESLALISRMIETTRQRLNHDI